MARLMFSRGFWLLVCATVVAGILASGWLMQTRPPPELPITPPTQAEYYLRDADVEVINDSGQLSHRMQTTELVRYNDHTSRLTDVRIDSLGGNQGVWHVEAGQALITENQEQLLLSGGVNMQTRGPQGATRLSTQTLKVELKDKRLTTADPVRIDGPEFHALATGMQAGFDSRNLILLNNVRTRYAP